MTEASDGHRVVCVDFNNIDAQGRVRLNVAGSLASLRAGEPLVPGQEVLLQSEDLDTIGTVEWSEEERIWVGRIDGTRINDR